MMTYDELVEYERKRHDCATMYNGDCNDCSKKVCVREYEHRTKDSMIECDNPFHMQPPVGWSGVIETIGKE